MRDHRLCAGERNASARAVLTLAFTCIVAAANGQDLAAQLEPLLASHQGQVAVAVCHFDTSESFFYRADEPMPTASLIKFPVMVEAYRQAAAGRVDLQEKLELSDGDQVPGSGILSPHFSAGLQLSLRDAIRLMIVYSDNTATNLVLDRIGLDATAQQMKRLGLPHTKIYAKVFRRETSIDPERSREFGLGSTTARETLRLYELLQRGELVSREASTAMKDHLLHCEDSEKLAHGLPPGTPLAHKSGSVSRVRCDAGIISSPAGPIGICVLTSENKDRRFSPENAANRLCGEVARITYHYFNPAPSASADADVTLELRLGASGRLVEDLQRTLNARLAPSPELSVDGAYGPNTRAAVLRFQELNGLPADGRVAADTWAALGPLVTRDPPVPDPEVVNRERLPVEPADSLGGVPFVTCTAWAVAEADSGRLLGAHAENRVLDIASTTKIMTAFVVLRLVGQQPDILEEEIVFSERADATTGSTAAIRAGERLPVREALYGLLLPSGNDAAVALAEHFGGRFRRRDDLSSATSASDDLELFVRQMNETAKELGMTQTTYRNPHGHTQKGHHSTAADLLRLAEAAWRLERFRTYVGTRQHGCTVSGPGGYRRPVVWRNTNRLLPIDGYDGIKTGTTSAAGACLVSTAARNGRRLFMVVLGSQSSAARYADSRNLYRWAWNQLDISSAE